MKKLLLLTLLLITFFTACSRRAVALNEYHPRNFTKLSSIATEISQKDLIEAKKRRAAYLKKYR